MADKAGSGGRRRIDRYYPIDIVAAHLGGIMYRRNTMSDIQSGTVETRYRRSPWRAVALSFIMPGIGHVYCGKLTRGLLFACLSLLPLPTLAITIASQSRAWTAALILMLVATAAVPILAAIDSFRLARHTRLDYQLKEYNRWSVYILLMVLPMGGYIGYGLHVRALYVEAFVIPSHSMHPTIVYGDRVLANKMSYISADPLRGDLIIFPNPDKRRQRYIKRVVAVAGDTVEIRNGVLIINGKKIERRELPEMSEASTGGSLPGTVFEETNAGASYRIILTSKDIAAKADMKPTVVPKYHCFVLGDNRHNSRDSRQFGSIPLAGIIGRIDYVYFPAENWSRFGRVR
jgi:signal peptidase I